MKTILSLLILMFLSLSALATNYYVTQSGAGSQNGLSLGNAWSLANYAASSTPTAGDTVFFSGTFTGQIELKDNGTYASMLTFDFSAATVADLGVNRIQFNSNKNINLFGGVFASDTNTEDDFLIDFQETACSNIFIANWSFSGNSNGATTFVANMDDLESYLTFSNNWCTNLCQFLYGSSQGFHDITVINNYIQQNVNTNTQSDLMDFADGHNYIIQGNYLDLRAPGNQNYPTGNARHNDVLQTWTSGGGYGPGVPYGLTVRYNWIQQDIGVGIGGTNSAFSVSDGSTSWGEMENLGSSNGVDAVDYYGNVFTTTTASAEANNGLGFDSCASTAVVRFYNNTIICRSNSPQNTVRFLSPGILYAENNAFDSDPSFSGNQLTWTFTIDESDYNYFYNFQSPSSTYTGSHGASNTDPKFNNFIGGDYSTSSSSPLRSSGDSSIGSNYNQGLAPGAMWPNPALVMRQNASWDVGAYQYQVSAWTQYFPWKMY